MHVYAIVLKAFIHILAADTLGNCAAGVIHFRQPKLVLFADADSQIFHKFRRQHFNRRKRMRLVESQHSFSAQVCRGNSGMQFVRVVGKIVNDFNVIVRADRSKTACNTGEFFQGFGTGF